MGDILFYSIWTVFWFISRWIWRIEQAPNKYHSKIYMRKTCLKNQKKQPNNKTLSSAAADNKAYYFPACVWFRQSIISQLQTRDQDSSD